MEEKRMVDQIYATVEEIAYLGAKVAELEWSKMELNAGVEKLTREVGKGEEMLGEDDTTSLIKFPPTFPFFFYLIFLIIF